MMDFGGGIFGKGVSVKGSFWTGAGFGGNGDSMEDGSWN